MLTRRLVVTPPLALTDVWSYPDVGGHTAATATYAGSLLGLHVPVGTTKHAYTPDGTGPPPDNSDGDYDYGWLGSHQRPTDHGLPTTVVQMGARPTSPPSAASCPSTPWRVDRATATTTSAATR
ncbi:MAG: hypothetical protein AB1673_07790 [Actinomycetota bacterium]